MAPLSQLAVLSLLLALAPGPGPAPDRPNILFLLTDDQAAGTLGCTGSAFPTPAIDRIAERGVRFSNAFVTTSLCAPSRASILSGRYARAHGLVGNRSALSPAVETFPVLLAEAGYETAWFGEWHLGRPRTGLRGFDHYASYEGQGTYEADTFWIDGEEREVSGFVDDVAVELAIDFMRREREGPFLRCVGFEAPHARRLPPARVRALLADATFSPPENTTALPPFPRPHELEELASRSGTSVEELVVPSDWARRFGPRRSGGGNHPAWTESMRSYHQLIATIDQTVGRLLAALEEAQLADETVIVLVSDNGISNGEHGAPGKRTAYDESMAVDLLISDPRQARERHVVDELVLNVDVAPTLLDLAGVGIPASMHGRSLLPLMEGTPGDWRKRFVYEHCADASHQAPSIVALRSARWKLITYPGHESWTELFDLASDPLETRNLVADRPRVREDLERALDSLEALLGPRPQED
jgi:arylsulfatase A-like enzyme